MSRISFHRLLELSQGSLDADSTKGVEAVRAGLNLKNPDFWEDFINLCGNSSAMSDLLDVPSEKISRWPSVIREAIDKVHEEDDSKNKKSEMLPTGNEPLADPNGADGGTDIADTRPMP